MDRLEEIERRTAQWQEIFEATLNEEMPSLVLDIHYLLSRLKAAEAVVEAARKDKMDDWGFDDEHPWQDSRHKMADDTVKFFETLAAYDKLKGGDA